MSGSILPSQARLTFLLVAVVALGANAFVTLLRLEPAWPLTPWESALFNEGWRWSHGLPVYAADRATHLYGPLLTVLLGGLERVVGFDFAAARLAFTLLGVGACLWWARLVLASVGAGLLALGSVALCAINLQTGLSFALSWADMPALFLSVAAYALLSRPQVGAVAGASAALLCVAAVFCKQTFGLTAVVFALLWAFHPTWRQRAGLWLLAPIGAVLLALGTVALTAPNLLRQMLVIPSTIGLLPERALDGLLQVGRGHPLLWIALGLTLWQQRERSLWREWRPWIAVGGVLLAGSVWTYAKAGGYYNSLLPVHLFLTLAALRLLADLLREAPSFVHGAWPALAAAFLCSSLGGLPECSRLLGMAQGDATRPQWVERLRALPGRVICPEEPALALQSTGYAGLSLYFELDAGAVQGQWPTQPPARIAQELAQARWLVTIRASYPTVLTPAWLQAQGWRPVAAPSEATPTYTLWSRP